MSTPPFTGSASSSTVFPPLSTSPIQSLTPSQGSETNAASATPTQLLHHFNFAIILKSSPPSSIIYKYSQRFSDPTLLTFVHKHYPISLSIFEELIAEQIQSTAFPQKLENMIGEALWDSTPPSLSDYERLYEVHRLLKPSPKVIEFTDHFLDVLICENENAPLGEKDKVAFAVLMNKFLHCQTERARLLFMSRYSIRQGDEEVINFATNEISTILEWLQAKLQEQETSIKMIDNFNFSSLLVQKIRKLGEEIQCLKHNLENIQETVISLEAEGSIVAGLEKEIKEKNDQKQLLIKALNGYEAIKVQKTEQIMDSIEEIQLNIALQMSQSRDNSYPRDLMRSQIFDFSTNTSLPPTSTVQPTSSSFSKPSSSNQR